MLKHLVLCGWIVSSLFAASSQHALSQGTKPGGTIEVRVNYTGSGTVNQTHPIYVSLWNSAAFVQEGSKETPIQTKPVHSKNGTAVFNNVAGNHAYVSAVYDPSGMWKAMSPPPAGSSLGLYADSDGKPERVTLTSEKKASIELKLDDSFKSQ